MAISSRLTVAIVHAFLSAGLIKDEHVPLAIRIAAEEIEVRKNMGDY